MRGPAALTCCTLRYLPDNVLIEKEKSSCKKRSGSISKLRNLTESSEIPYRRDYAETNKLPRPGWTQNVKSQYSGKIDSNNRSDPNDFSKAFELVLRAITLSVSY